MSRKRNDKFTYVTPVLLSFAGEGVHGQDSSCTDGSGAVGTPPNDGCGGGNVATPGTSSCHAGTGA